MEILLCLFYVFFFSLNSLLELRPTEENNILFASLTKSKGFSVDSVFNKRRNNREASYIKKPWFGTTIFRVKRAEERSSSYVSWQRPKNNFHSSSWGEYWRTLILNKRVSSSDSIHSVFKKAAKIKRWEGYSQGWNRYSCYFKNFY